MVNNRAAHFLLLFGCLGAALSTPLLAQGWDYSSGHELPFAGTRQENNPGISFRFSTDDPKPKVSFENHSSFDATGNLSIDNDLQQDIDRCNRMRNQLRSKDSYKLSC